MSDSSANEEGEIRFQIAPMVDVVFVLLLFFMACAGLKEKERHLTLPLPARGEPSETIAVIDIDPKGVVAINDSVLAQPQDHDLRALRTWFREAHELFGDSDAVLVSPAGDTRHERIMEVLCACRAAGVTKLAFR
jgi:biopolymer transport protein ExbD